MNVGGGPSGYRAQAEYLREVYRGLLRVRATYGIRGAIWFNLVDTRSGTYWFERTGLFDLRDDPKPSWRALQCITGARAC